MGGGKLEAEWRRQEGGGQEGKGGVERGGRRGRLILGCCVMGMSKGLEEGVPDCASNLSSLPLPPAPTTPCPRYVAPGVHDQHGHTILRLGTGVLLHTLMSNMEAAIQPAAAPAAAAQLPGSSPAAGPRMYLYSGHDSSLMPILSALGLDLHAWPPFVSNIVLELWELPAGAAGKEGEAAARHVVRVMYNQSELDIPHCPHGRSWNIPPQCMRCTVSHAERQLGVLECAIAWHVCRLARGVGRRNYVCIQGAPPHCWSPHPWDCFL